MSVECRFFFEKRIVLKIEYVLYFCDVEKYLARNIPNHKFD